MKKDTKCLILALVLLTLSLTTLTAGAHGQWLSKFWWLIWVVNIMFFGYIILFIAFLYFNHELAKENPLKSLRGYKNAVLLCVLLIVIGVVCAVAGFDFYGVFSNILIMGTICPLIYAVLGYYDIKKLLKQSSKIK
ncbi:MAG: hypothetical protein AB1485_00545 [Candidatus Thermoplasmatota archaeon]